MQLSRRILLTAAAAAALLLLLLCLVMFLFSASSATSLPDCSEDLGLVFADNTNALEVLAVIDRSPASRCGVQPGDRILSVNNTSVSTLEELDALIQEGTVSSSDLLTVRLQRGFQTMDLSLRMKQHCIASVF